MSTASRFSSTRTTVDFDVKKEQEALPRAKGLTPEQVKQMQEAQAKQEKKPTPSKL